MLRLTSWDFARSPIKKIREPIVRRVVANHGGFQERKFMRDDISATIGTITIRENRICYDFFAGHFIIRKSYELLCLPIGITAKMPPVASKKKR